MAESEQGQQKPARKSSRLVRVALFVTLALVLLCAIRWVSLRRGLERGVELYEAGKYQEAVDVLQPLMHKPLARLRIRRIARRTIGLCKAELATQIAMKERSAEGYRKALDLLEEAKRLAGPTPEIEKGIKEYTEYLHKEEHPLTPPSISPAPPPAPVAPPATPPATN